jgi:uncharacterized SAM-binding protein YcdF (DUF218 family)
MQSPSTQPGPQAERSQGLTLIILGILIAACLFVLLLPFGFRKIAGLLMVADPLEKADAGVVLGGGDETRIEEAASLYKERYIRYLVLTDTGAELTNYDTRYVDEMRIKAVKLGVPVNLIYITEKLSDSTAEEAQAVKILAHEQGFRSLIVITDPYHTYRTRLVYQGVFAGDDISIIVHPVQNHWYQPTTWWKSLKGWQMTVLEYIKLAGYYLTK